MGRGVGATGWGASGGRWSIEVGSDGSDRSVPALVGALSRSLNIILMLDVVFITKDTGGVVEAVDFEVHGDVAVFHALDGGVGGLISDDIS